MCREKGIEADMRNRGLLMLLLSGLLAFAPWLQSRRLEADCVAQQGGVRVAASPYATGPGIFDGLGNDQLCPTAQPLSPWMNGLGVLSIGCFAGFLFFTIRGIAERRREQALLRGAGVYVNEDDLPLDD